MIALVRPESWNLPLFLHVLGAIVLVGSVAATVLAASRSENSVVLRGVAFRTMLVLSLPAWVLMRLAGEWTRSREDVTGDPGWLGTGYIVGDAGLIILIVATIVGWWSTRRQGRRWPARTLTVLGAIYLVGLLVAMVAMSGKPS